VPRKPAATKDGAPRRRRRKPLAPSSALPAAELAPPPPGELQQLARALEADGGRALAIYREPYAGHWSVFAALPLERVTPTPYQRPLSKAHVERLARAISKIGRFLDPIIAVRSPEGSYWTPNGNHRLAVMRELGARAIMAILVPEPAVAYQILALNTEKAHNLRERALEVVSMYRELARLGPQTEPDYALEFEEPALITLGFCYEARPRFSGGAYQSVVKAIDAFLDRPLRDAVAVREQRAKALLELDDRVTQVVERLKARGFSSPYLRNFVVARLNYLRFRPKTAAKPEFDEALAKIRAQAERFDAEKIRPQDLATAAGGTAEE
jgi:ParB family chromosome partitioning protein